MPRSRTPPMEVNEKMLKATYGKGAQTVFAMGYKTGTPLGVSGRGLIKPVCLPTASWLKNFLSKNKIEFHSEGNAPGNSRFVHPQAPFGENRPEKWEGRGDREGKEKYLERKAMWKAMGPQRDSGKNKKEKPLWCQYCGRGYTNPDALKNHEESLCSKKLK